MKFLIELRDRDFNVLERLDKEVIDLNWTYARIGGCGEFSFRLPRKLFEEKSISGDFNIRIYKRNDDTQSYDLWYQGLVENKTPEIRGNTENIQISGHGYITQLSRIYLNNVTYTSQEVSVIVKAILDTYITPETDVEYSASDIEATTFTVDTINFNTDALSAMQTLADIVGTREWGVDKSRNFYFKARSTTVGLRYHFGKHIKDYSENQDFKEVVNRIVVQGAQVGGTYYTATFNDTTSQLKYGIRTRVVQNSAVVSATVADQLADAIFAEKNDVIRKAEFSLVGTTPQVEATIPIPLVNIIGKEITYGEKRYGTFLYSGYVDRVVNRINYGLINNNSLQINMELGYLRPLLSEQISQIEYQLEQLRSAAL